MEKRKKLKDLPYEHLDQQTMASLREVAEFHQYDTPAYLFYEDQIPIVAFLLIKGHIQLLKSKKVKKVLQGGEIVGLRELMNDEPSQYTAYIMSNAKVCFLDRSTVFEILKEKADDKKLLERLKPVLREIIEGHPNPQSA